MQIERLSCPYHNNRATTVRYVECRGARCYAAHDARAPVAIVRLAHGRQSVFWRVMSSVLFQPSLKPRGCVMRTRQQTLTSVVSYPERGPWGSADYRGNCNGYLIKDLLEYYQPQRVLDPMEGSGTTRAVCADLGIAYVGNDLANGAGVDLYSRDFLIWLRKRMPVDFIFWHPPYGPMIRYSDHPRDLSTLPIPEFRRVLTMGAQRLYEQLSVGGHLAILMGVYRKGGDLYRFPLDLMAWREPTEPEIIKVQHHCTSDRQDYSGRFIPIVHEYLLIWKKGGARHD